MSLILSLVGRLARVALVAPTIARVKRRAIRLAIGGAVVAILGLFCMTYLLLALRIAIEPYLGPLWSPLAIGGVLGLGALIGYFALLRPRKAREEFAGASESAIPRSLAEPVHQLETQIAKRPLISLGLALAGGFAAAMILRQLRAQRRNVAPQPSAPQRTNGRADPDGDWVREVVRREMDRRRTNGRDART